MENKKNFIINVLYLAIIFALIWVVDIYALPYLMPFVWGGLIAALFKRPINFLVSKKASRTVSSIIILLAFYAVLITIAILVGFKVVSDIIDYINYIPGFYTKEVEPAIYEVINRVGKLLETLDPETLETVQTAFTNLITSFSEWVSSFSVKVVTFLTGIITGAPGFMLRALCTVISSIYFAIDYDKIKDFLIRQLNPKAQLILNESINFVKRVIFGCIKSYGIIMSVTFAELMLGFTITGIVKEYRLLVAFLISLVDLMPILGCGTVLVPWCIIDFIIGEYYLGACVLGIHLFIYIIRNIIEPRIVGEELGLHPLVTLVTMFVGAEAVGGLGIFAGPILTSLAVYLNKQGLIKFFN